MYVILNTARNERNEESPKVPNGFHHRGILQVAELPSE